MKFMEEPDMDVDLSLRGSYPSRIRKTRDSDILIQSDEDSVMQSSGDGRWK